MKRVGRQRETRESALRWFSAVAVGLLCAHCGSTGSSPPSSETASKGDGDDTSPGGEGGDGDASVCELGATQSCVGPAGCDGGQVCREDQRGWQDCDCGVTVDGSGGAGTGGQAGNGGGLFGDGDMGGSGGRDLVGIAATLPSGFTANTAAPQDWECQDLPGATCLEPAGGLLRLGAVDEVHLSGSSSCRNVLRGIVRDFEHSHGDFGGDSDGEDLVNAGMVESILDETRKPVPAGASAAASAIEDWFDSGAGESVAYVVDIWLEPTGGRLVFDSSRFFPLEGVGTISGADNDGTQRNFGFTTELHAAFRYLGGEVFSFTGDDDVWVYLNGQLAIDLGGVHSQASRSVDFDSVAAQIGMSIGEVYDLDLFHAERNPTGSNFRIETSLSFTECQILNADIVAP